MEDLKPRGCSASHALLTSLLVQEERSAGSVNGFSSLAEADPVRMTSSSGTSFNDPKRDMKFLNAVYYLNASQLHLFCLKLENRSHLYILLPRKQRQKNLSSDPRSFHWYCYKIGGESIGTHPLGWHTCRQCQCIILPCSLFAANPGPCHNR